jgi:hypothetical protein
MWIVIFSILEENLEEMFKLAVAASKSRVDLKNIYFQGFESS